MIEVSTDGGATWVDVSQLGVDPGWSIADIAASGIDNTPFPALVPEPSVCTATSAASAASTVVAMQAAPATSLAALDAACVAADGP